MWTISIPLAAMITAAISQPSAQDCRVFADCNGGMARWINLGRQDDSPGKRVSTGTNTTELAEDVNPDKGPKLHYVSNTLTWDNARTFCGNFGKALCTFDQICLPMNGTRNLVNDVIHGDHFVPVHDEHNEWVSIGDHHVHPCFLHSGRWQKPSWGISTTAMNHKGYVYCCKSDAEATLPQMVYQYMGKSLTYTSSEEHCQNQDRRLCYSSEICHRSKPQFGVIQGNMWVAVKDRRNEWIQIGNRHGACQLYGIKFELPAWGTRSDGSHLESVGYVLCCSRDARL